ncbi:glycoside hydrolase family 52 protein [Paenibacillus roseipurpureus]|uniref:Glycoside hydrolase family 52 protein n=1 Tax=Paenibacillus roseopurpureus TaxID=2918901 RepID=A0AA96RMW0_9BACL|nr:glycoside hydrolase family 52 protein [Paenibacillus sp. MBLB1832]WNR47090.1 glycoside hydrolase family 52 protein [Paenibacillus sp. MBLB1832]
MGDALTVLGSRLGLAWDPANHQAYLVRHGNHPGLPLQLHAGIDLGDRILTLPLAGEERSFEFMDQEITATTMSLSGIDPTTGIHVKLTARIPFRPRDNFFSTVPVVYLDLEVKRLPSSFRWTAQYDEIVEGKLFLGFSGKGFDFHIHEPTGHIEATYNSVILRPFEEDDHRQAIRSNEETIACKDRIAILSGEWDGACVTAPFSLHKGNEGTTLSLAWCVWDQPLLNVLGKRSPFKYTQSFKNIEQVVDWSIQHANAVKENSSKVDHILSNHTLGDTTSKLLAQTLHAWLMNTWWVVRDNGQDWFTVWEGNCYFHSTVDVEYTQGPFYLAFWPELLELELNEWPFFGKDGQRVLGESGEGTLFLSHDMGVFGDSTKQYYHHEMEVEESTNYILLAYTHWRRTGRDATIKQHAQFIRQLMDFIVRCDTTGNGIPDKGCANTVDDASPAIQYGSEQVYLGVKSLAAIQAGIHILQHVGELELQAYDHFTQAALATIEEQGWLDDHYAVTLSRTMDGTVDPWTGEPQTGELLGWDAYHVYTPNGLSLLDMVGHQTGLRNDRLRRDMATATDKTLGRYGCRHTSYIDMQDKSIFIPGLASHSRKVGWISMNMLRDIAAAYRGLDLLHLAENYWSWQTTTNSQQIALFFETFYGNSLSFYPRGVAVFGYLDAAAGFVYDAVVGTKSFAPVRGSLQVPILLFADWEQGTVPMVMSSLDDGQITYRVET